MHELNYLTRHDRKLSPWGLRKCAIIGVTSNILMVAIYGVVFGFPVDIFGNADLFLLQGVLALMVSPLIAIASIVGLIFGIRSFTQRRRRKLSVLAMVTNSITIVAEIFLLLHS